MLSFEMVTFSMSGVVISSLIISMIAGVAGLGVGFECCYPVQCN